MDYKYFHVITIICKQLTVTKRLLNTECETEISSMLQHKAIHMTYVIHTEEKQMHFLLSCKLHLTRCSFIADIVILLQAHHNGSPLHSNILFMFALHYI
jgi:hypothetical protein